jgi:hypothetical protein
MFLGHDTDDTYRVGRPGDKGDVEISDLIFTNSGPTAGAIFMVRRYFLCRLYDLSNRDRNGTCVNKVKAQQPCGELFSELAAQTAQVYGLVHATKT